jgi:hypothetical protein
MPEVEFSLALAGCFVSCTAYAALLTTQKGQRFTSDITWATVVIGVSIVLLWLGTQGHHGMIEDFAFFAAGGAPLVGRAAYLWFVCQRQYVDYLRDRAERARSEAEGSE